MVFSPLASIAVRFGRSQVASDRLRLLRFRIPTQSLAQTLLKVFNVDGLDRIVSVSVDREDGKAP